MTVEEMYDDIMARFDAIEDRLPPAIAAVSEIGGKYGDPRVKFTPKQWKGAKVDKDTVASKCSPAFLEVYAETLEWMARNPKEGDKPEWADYNRKDARLCRRWAIEIREGRAKPPKSDPVSNEELFGKKTAPKRNAYEGEDFPKAGADDDIPF